MQEVFDIHRKQFLEDIIEILEKKNGREFQEITTKNCKVCGKEVSIRELKEGHFGLLCRDCYNDYSRKYVQNRDSVRKRTYIKKKNYNDVSLHFRGRE